MILKEKQQFESLLRVQAFLGANPAPAPASYAEPKAVLDDVIAQLREHTGAQVLGFVLSEAQQKRQKAAMQQLREHHMRPIVAIAKAEVEVDAGIADALRLPAGKLPVLRLLAAATAMLEVVTPMAATFVAHGRPADFLERFKAAQTAVEESVDTRGDILGTHVGARAGIRMQLKRGRLAVGRLDSIVRVAFEGNDVVLARWETAKRVKGLRASGGSGPATDPTAEAVPLPATGSDTKPAAA